MKQIIFTKHGDKFYQQTVEVNLGPDLTGPGKVAIVFQAIGPRELDKSHPYIGQPLATHVSLAELQREAFALEDERNGV